MTWEAAERVQKSETGEFRAMIGGEWVPVAKAQKSEDGQFRVSRAAVEPEVPAQPKVRQPEKLGMFDRLADRYVAAGGRDASQFGLNVATGASGLMRGAANLVSDGAGDAAWPKAPGSKGSTGKFIGEMLDPVALTIGGGVMKALPYAPVLSKAATATAPAVKGGGALAFGQNVGSGSLMGGTIGGLSDEGSAVSGGVIGAAANVVLPPAVSGVTKLAGKFYDAIRGRYGEINAGKILRAASGGDLAAIKAATAAAGPELTATQAAYGIKNPIWDAMGDLAAQNDPTHFTRQAALTKDLQLASLQRIAGAPNQTEARVLRESQKGALSGLLGPHFEREMGAANTAGQLQPGVQSAADKLGYAASGRVGDVRRLSLAQMVADDVAQSGRGRLGADSSTNIAGMPRLAGKFSYGQELSDLAERKAQGAADSSLILGEGSRFAQRQADSLAAYGLKPIDGGGLSRKIGEMLNDPKVGTNQDAATGLNVALKQIAEWSEKGGGQIKAEAIQGIRMNLNKNIERALGAGDPKAIKAATARIEMRVRPMLDAAISDAGGTQWQNVMKSFSAGMRDVDRRKMGAKALEMFEKTPDKFAGLVRGNAPKDVEKIFGPGNYNIETQMGRQFGPMDRVAGALMRDKNIAESAAKGANKAVKIIEENTPRVKLFNVLDPRVAIINRVIAEGELKIGKATSRALIDGMKTGKSANELLNAMPTGERALFIKAMAPYLQAGGISATQ